MNTVICLSTSTSTLFYSTLNSIKFLSIRNDLKTFYCNCDSFYDSLDFSQEETTSSEILTKLLDNNPRFLKIKDFGYINKHALLGFYIDKDQKQIGLSFVKGYVESVPFSQTLAETLKDILIHSTVKG